MDENKDISLEKDNQTKLDFSKITSKVKKDLGESIFSSNFAILALSLLIVSYIPLILSYVFGPKSYIEVINILYLTILTGSFGYSLFLLIPLTYSIFLLGPFYYSLHNSSIELSRNNSKIEFSNLSTGFKNNLYLNKLKIGLISILISIAFIIVELIFAYILLTNIRFYSFFSAIKTVFFLSIPIFIIKLIVSYIFSMVYFISKDNPETNAIDVYTKSYNLTKNYKAELFKIDLKLLGWYIVGLITVIGIFWAFAYRLQIFCEVYESIKENNEESIKENDVEPIKEEEITTN